MTASDKRIVNGFAFPVVLFGAEASGFLTHAFSELLSLSLPSLVLLLSSSPRGAFSTTSNFRFAAEAPVRSRTTTPSSAVAGDVTAGPDVAVAVSGLHAPRAAECAADVGDEGAGKPVGKKGAIVAGNGNRPADMPVV
jgi:hypothetical protein